MSQKRDRFIADLRQRAKVRRLTFRLEQWRGKGGHAMVWVGDKCTTLPAREIRENQKSTRSGRSIAGSCAFPMEAKP